MNDSIPGPFAAFEGPRRIASGDLETVALAIHDRVASTREALLAFDETTGRQVDIDLRGDREGVRLWVRNWLRYHAAQPAAGASGGGASREAAEAAAPPRRRGRPRLGVVSREVTLLPRHWAWLSSQGSSASAVLRRLIDEARKVDAGPARRREARDATYRFIAAMAGDRPGFENAVRALYGSDRDTFEGVLEGWPPDVAELAGRLATGAFEVADTLPRGYI
ncbi:DUF2239 family protein [Gaopeijia maritima]|uniref:DUF2239 family protein n=1 Tax=Gaopeijia maritima TaxID=3119007 RepID=A0ABU9EE16_9BACT